MTHPLASVLLAVNISLFGMSTARAQTNDHAPPQPAAHTLVEALRAEAYPTDDCPEGGRLDPDRPHLPEASTAAGKRHVLLEGGYTLNEHTSSSSSETYPEALLRIGIFSDWFELRIGESSERTVFGGSDPALRSQNLYLGVKVAVTDSKGWRPAIAVIPQMTIPVGSHAAPCANNP